METQEGFNPEEYTRWAAERAFQYLKEGKLKEAIDSMVSDLSKDSARPAEQVSMIGMMGMSLRGDPELNEQKVREFIEGFPGVPKQPKRELPKYKAPEYKKPELSEEDRKNAEDFIDRFVLRNEGLTPEAKELVVDTARARRDSWSVKDFVTNVTQEGSKITIQSKSGEVYLYIRK